MGKGDRMKIKDEFPKTNKELLEHAKLFKFNYMNHIITIEARSFIESSGWIIICDRASVYDRNKKDFVLQGTVFSCDVIFDNIYDAYEVVRELIK